MVVVRGRAANHAAERDDAVVTARLRRNGIRTLLVRTGKFRPEKLESSGVEPDGILPSIASLPAWLEERAA